MIIQCPPHILPTLAWRPFIDAMPIGDTWMPLMVLAIFLVALTYRTLRREDLDDYKGLLVESTMLGGQILGFLIAAGAVVWVIIALV